MTVFGWSRRGIAAAMVLSGLLLPPVAAVAQQKDGVIDVPNADKAMAAAITKARSSLAVFWRELDKPSPGVERFSLKVGLATDDKGFEHIWVQDVKRGAGGKLSGVLANHPRKLSSKKAGDAVEFDEAQISDWQFVRNGKIVGNETMRPLLARMPKADADRYRAMLESP